jgi:DNA polymerase/3'-5' exonuclease PolX
MEATMKESLHGESARDELPASVIELLQLRGLGAKRVQVLRALGVQSLAELRVAAQEQRLRCVPGFSPALEENVLRAVTAHVEWATRRADAIAADKLRARRQSTDHRTARRCERQGHAANLASPTGWMRSIWRSAAA